ncbi:MAG: hypothetical protein WCY62_05960 [Clostridia bacterium]|jgi:Flp pilus assembly protein TadD
MEVKEMIKDTNDLGALCNTVKELINTQNYEKCENLICCAMEKYPHAPEPHNLFGILLEKKGDHLMAMKHFRAAWVLDPTYIPARLNLDCYGTFLSNGLCVYCESDLEAESKNGKYSSYNF